MTISASAEAHRLGSDPLDGQDENSRTRDDAPESNAGGEAPGIGLDGAAVGENHESSHVKQALPGSRKAPSVRLVALLLLPALSMVIVCVAAYFKHGEGTASAARAAGIEAGAAARDITVTMLSYGPDTVEQTLVKAQGRLTGGFRDEYTKLMNDVVIPGAKAGGVTTAVAVPAVAVVSADPDHVVTLVYVNQHVTAGSAPPSDNATTVRATLDKVEGQWHVAGFEPI